ncbi:MAG: RNase H family protein [Chloroflexota bacterium]
MSNSTRPEVTMYTDGGCSPNPGLGGYAAILVKQGAEKIVTGAEAETSNYRMELMAVVAGLEALSISSNVTIFSDNNNVVRGFNEWLAGWCANGWRNSRKKAVDHADLWQRIQKQSERHSITLVKVKAHVADQDASDAEKMNNRADALVSEARATYLAEQASVTAPSEPEEEAESQYRLYIAGSRHASDKMLDYTRRIVARAIENSWTIVVGDNPQGVDQEVIKELCRLNYSNVIVVGIAKTPRNGGVSAGQYVQYGKSYLERDQAMARCSDRGIFVWNGQSRGTETAYRYMQSLNKTQHLMDFSATFAEGTV